MDESITGIGVNTANIYDATLYKSEDTELIYDDKYQDGVAIKCNRPEVPIFDTGILPAGTFDGAYNIGFYYDSNTTTTQGTPLMRFEVYENGVLMPEDTSIYADGIIYENDLNYFKGAYNYGLHDTKVLKANCTYQVIVKTSTSLSNTAILDYITFSRIPPSGSINGFAAAQTAGMRNAGSSLDITTSGNQLTFEVIFGVISGTWVVDDSATMGFTYNTKFKNVLIALPVMYKEGDGKLTLDWESVNYTNSQVLINIRNNSTVSVDILGNVNNVRILVMGYI